MLKYTAQGHMMFQLTAARRRLGVTLRFTPKFKVVSTHSRPKAAGSVSSWVQSFMSGFNSQPPEGGWAKKLRRFMILCVFQLTAARRRLVWISPLFIGHAMFQLTAARRRLVDL